MKSRLCFSGLLFFFFFFFTFTTFILYTSHLFLFLLFDIYPLLCMAGPGIAWERQ